MNETDLEMIICDQETAELCFLVSLILKSWEFLREKKWRSFQTKIKVENKRGFFCYYSLLSVGVLRK